VTPATGTTGTQISIVGTAFRAGAQAFVGDMPLDALLQVSVTELVGRVPAGFPVDLAVGVRVRNADANEATLGGFMAVAPRLQFVDNATRPAGSVGSVVTTARTESPTVSGRCRRRDAVPLRFD
jgi:hypothetical protein